MRILYIHSTLVPPPVDATTDRFNLLSETLEGDVLQPLWFATPSEVEEVFGSGSYPVYTRGRFRYHWFLANRYSGLRQKLEMFRFYLREGTRLRRERGFDCIVAYSHMTTALIAGLIKLLTGTKLIVEVATSPDLVYITEHPRPTLRDRLMKLYSDLCLHLSLWLADRAHLLYPAQLAPYRFLRRVKGSVFHEFVPVSSIPRHRSANGRYVLFVGSPWYLKGVDRLTDAFRKLAPDFPDVKLKLLGWYSDREQWEMLTGGSSQIELLRARPNPETLEIISACELLVQPSRCEGMGRVLVEAMGAGVPVIGSDVGGIPHILRDQETGFVVAGGDPAVLEARMRRLLLDAELRDRMGQRGHELAHAELSEKVYVQKFTEMVKCAVSGARE